MAKLTRAEAQAVAAEARRVPAGIATERIQLHLPTETMANIKGQTPQQRGASYEMGTVMEADGYLMLYEIIDRLGVRIISTIFGQTLAIVCKHKTYEGANQSDLLIQIIKEAIELGDST